MGSLSPLHWLIVLAVVLVLFGGGSKISSLMGDFAKGIKSFKKNMSEDESMEAGHNNGHIAPPTGYQTQSGYPQGGTAPNGATPGHYTQGNYPQGGYPAGAPGGQPHDAVPGAPPVPPRP